MEIRTRIDEKQTKELLHNAVILAIVCFIISLLCIGGYFLFVFALQEDPGDILNIVLLISGILLFILSILLYVTQMNTIKRAAQFVREVKYELSEENISYEVYRDEQLIESGKLSYQDFLDFRETKNYLFVRLKNNNYLAVDKVDGLSDLLISKGLKKKR